MPVVAPRDPLLTRRSFLRRSTVVAGSAIASRGIYDVLAGFDAPARAATTAAKQRREEQYLVDGLDVVLDSGVPVIVPPVYTDVITARLAPDRWTPGALRAAQRRLSAALAAVERPHPKTAAGLTVVVAWGLPYFRRYVAGPWSPNAPVDLALDAAGRVGADRLAVLDAIRFPSDPADVHLENNDVAFKLRSDDQRILAAVEAQLFDDVGGPGYVSDLFEVTSKRIGYLGRGFGTTSAGKALAVAAGVPGASSIPDRSQLMMGFTSSQADALGPDNIVSFETLPGVTNQFPSGYFARGCAMHLSHLTLDLERWYGKSYAERVAQMHSPRVAPPTDGTVTIRNGPGEVSSLDDVKGDAARGVLGHTAALQTVTRLATDVTDNYGRFRRKGTAVPVREDFNTLDNPFSWYRDSSGNVVQPVANQPGLHFAVFVPTSDRFHRARLAMDGVLPDGTDVRPSLPPEQVGINAMMRATHRQNFLVPPRAHRAFPLAELL